MLGKNHLLILDIISSVLISCSVASWASSLSVNQRPAPLYAANESIRTAGQRDSSTATDKIDGKVTDTSGLPLSGITFSLQVQGESVN